MGRLCEHKGCRAILSPKNKGILCAFHKSDSRQELTCKAYGCGEFITRNNKSGLCRSCSRQAKMVAKPHRYCITCSNTLHHNNSLGTCGPCRSQKRKEALKVCKCGQYLDYRNKSGKCFSCMYPGVQRSGTRQHVIVQNAPYTVKELARAAAFLTFSSMDELAGPTKPRRVSRIRFAVWHLAEPHYSYNQIGSVFGNRDHTTIISGCKRAAELMEGDNRFRILVDTIKRETLARRQIERLAA